MNLLDLLEQVPIRRAVITCCPIGFAGLLFSCKAAAHWLEVDVWPYRAPRLICTHFFRGIRCLVVLGNAHSMLVCREKLQPNAVHITLGQPGSNIAAEVKNLQQHLGSVEPKPKTVQINLDHDLAQVFAQPFIEVLPPNWQITLYSKTPELALQYYSKRSNTVLAITDLQLIPLDALSRLNALAVWPEAKARELLPMFATNDIWFYDPKELITDATAPVRRRLQEILF